MSRVKKGQVIQKRKTLKRNIKGQIIEINFIKYDLLQDCCISFSKILRLILTLVVTYADTTPSKQLFYVPLLPLHSQFYLISSHVFCRRLSAPSLSESMILLGSIERLQLQSLLSVQLGRQQRLEYLRQLAQDNGTRDHPSSLTTDSTPSSPCSHSHINASSTTSARQAVRFLVSTQQV